MDGKNSTLRLASVSGFSEAVPICMWIVRSQKHALTISEVWKIRNWTFIEKDPG